MKEPVQSVAAQECVLIAMEQAGTIAENAVAMASSPAQVVVVVEQ